MISKPIYIRVWAALLGLLILTCGIAYLDLKPFNTVLAMSIALAKMALVILYFMHVRWSSKLIWLFVGAGFIWLGIMITLAMSDYMTRGEMHTTEHLIETRRTAELDGSASAFNHPYGTNANYNSSRR